MAHSRGSRFPRRTGAGRRVTWNGGPQGTYGTINTSTVILSATSAEAAGDDLTIVRTRGRIILNLEVAGAAGQGFEWAFGMGIVSNNAFGIGVTAVPDPIADEAWDGWFVYEQGTLMSRDSTPLLDGIDSVSQLIVIDSKAMRKIHLTDVIVGVLGVVELGTSQMRAFLQTRILVKLP